MGIDFNVQPGPGLFESLTPDWQLKQQLVNQGNALAGVNLVNPDGSINPASSAQAANLLAKTGAIAPALSLLQAGIAQQQIRDASKLTGGMAAWLSPGGAAPAASPATASQPSSGGANPEVVNYIRTRAPIYGINPNVALAVGSSEGLRGFDPNGKPNLGDDGSSAGPFQLHYGGVAGGANSGVGLGDDFTKATGLDARDPSTWKEQIDFALKHASRNGWAAFHGAAKIGVGSWSGIGEAQPSSPSADPAQPDTDAPPPASSHPYAPSTPAAAAPEQGNGPWRPTRVASAGAPPMPAPLMPSAPSTGQPPAGPTIAPVQQGPVGGVGQGAPQPAAPRPAPVPVSFAPPPPLSPNAGVAPHPLDPSFGGQVPKAWLDRGWSAGQFVAYARTMAGIASNNPYAKGAGEQWSKIADGLSTSIDKSLELSGNQKDARDPGVLLYEAQRDANKAQARVNAQNSSIAVQGASARAEATQAGAALGKLPGQLAADANGAKLQNNMLDELVEASNQFRMGYGATAQQNLNAKLVALSDAMGVDPGSLRSSVGSFQDFQKLAGQLSRQAVKDTGSNRAGVQELQYVSSVMPTPEMSKDGFLAVSTQMKGIGDYKVAKAQAADAYGAATGAGRGSLRGFETDWNRNVSPAAFVLHRMQVDQPQMFQSTVQRLSQTPQGKAILQNARAGLSWANTRGLLD